MTLRGIDIHQAQTVRAKDLSAYHQQGPLLTIDARVRHVSFDYHTPEEKGTLGDLCDVVLYLTKEQAQKLASDLASFGLLTQEEPSASKVEVVSYEYRVLDCGCLLKRPQGSEITGMLDGDAPAADRPTLHRGCEDAKGLKQQAHSSHLSKLDRSYAMSEYRIHIDRWQEGETPKAGSR